jgi:hypothetical protein
MRIQGIGSTGKFNPALKAASALTGKASETRGLLTATTGLIPGMFSGKSNLNYWALRSAYFNDFAKRANAILDQPQNIGKAEKFTLSAGPKMAPSVHHGWWFKFDRGEYDNSGPWTAINDWLSFSGRYGITNNPGATAPTGGPAVVQTGGPSSFQTGGATDATTGAPKETTGGRTATEEPKKAGMSPLVIGGIAAAALIGFILLRRK